MNPYYLMCNGCSRYLGEFNTKALPTAVVKADILGKFWCHQCAHPTCEDWNDVPLEEAPKEPTNKSTTEEIDAYLDYLNEEIDVEVTLTTEI